MHASYVLLFVFTAVGVLLIGLGTWIHRRMYGKHSVEVRAECIDVNVEDYQSGFKPEDYTYYKNTNRPVYKYTYDGKEYISQPFLQSNRPGYNPQTGPCTIRINPDHPERVYSTERKYAAMILDGIGIVYLVIALIVWIVMKQIQIF